MHIGLFLTYGNSLDLWRAAGILDREMAIYSEHAKRHCELTIVTYGGQADTQFEDVYQYLKIAANRWTLPTRIYSLLGPYFWSKPLSGVDVIKTNQMYGAHVAASVAKKLKKPLYIRQGYSFFESEQKKWGADSRQAKVAQTYEKRMALEADWLTLPSEHLVAEFSRRNPAAGQKISTLPNYVVDREWNPVFNSPARDGPFKIGYLGKFTEQKNLVTLIEACAGLNVELHLIGSGPLEDQLNVTAKRTNVCVSFHGRLHQHRAREVLRRCHCFILPSNYEGQPKALIEAMAFGMPVIGTNIKGIAEIIEDNKTGVVVEKSRASIRSGIKRVVETPTKELERLGQNARSYVIQRHGLKRVAEQDFNILLRLGGAGSFGT